MPQDSTKRFSDSVHYYVKYRPGYPAEVISLLKEKCGLTKDQAIADIGSGTGIFTKLLLDNGNQVYGIEPNSEMREAGEIYLQSYPHFISINARAEATTLPSQSVHLITCAQAFHWFSNENTQREFLRILKPQGYLFFVFNLRVVNSTPFMQAFETLLQTYGIDYEKAATDTVVDATSLFLPFKNATIHSDSYPNQQILDWDGLKGRLLSCSYIPRAGSEKFEPMMCEAEKIFNRFHQHGFVELIYETRCYYFTLR